MLCVKLIRTSARNSTTFHKLPWLLTHDIILRHVVQWRVGVVVDRIEVDALPREHLMRMLLTIDIGMLGLEDTSIATGTRLSDKCRREIRTSRRRGDSPEENRGDTRCYIALHISPHRGIGEDLCATPALQRKDITREDLLILGGRSIECSELLLRSGSLRRNPLHQVAIVCTTTDSLRLALEVNCRQVILS